MSDLLVKLYDLPINIDEALIKFPSEIDIFRAIVPNKNLVVHWVKENFGENWAGECEVSFYNKPVSCFIAIENNINILGFSCYEATGKAFFGPTGVLEKYRGKGIGKILLLKAMHSLREVGYSYAIIGGAASSAVEFYKKTVNAVIIEGSEPGIYKNFIKD